MAKVTLSELTPEQRAKVEAFRSRHRTPEARAEEQQVRAAIQQEFPPREIDDRLRVMLATLRQIRERQGLSLADVAERTRMDRATISKLENGKIVNPTIMTLRTYAGALGKQLDYVLEDAGATGSSW